MQTDVSPSTPQPSMRPHGPANRQIWWSVVAIAAVVTGATWWSVEAANDLPAETARHANELSKAFRYAAERVTPTVVKITTYSRAGAAQTMRLPSNPFEGTPFEDYFKDDDLFRGFRDAPRAPARQGLGSGVIIDPSGIILTNHHVVNSADEVYVRLNDGREFKATDIRVDPQTDLAVLRIEGAGQLPAARMGNSDELEIGDWVIAIGHPFSLDATVSAGIISGKGRGLASVSRAQFLQTDAAINPGNSGGPLVNLNGEIIGINTAIATNSGGYQGIGFAVPIDLAKWVVEQLKDRGSVQRAYLGVKIEPLTADLARQFRVQPNQGVLVAEVNADTPAARAGLQDGDVIVAFDGKAVQNPRELQAVVERSPTNRPLPMTVVRDGRERQITVTLEPLPEELVVSSAPIRERARSSTNNESYRSDKLGLEVTNMTTEVARRLGYEGFDGVLVSRVEPGSPADRLGLSEGMLVLAVDRQEVKNVEQFKKVMEKASLSDGVLLQVRSAGGNRFLVLKIN